MDNKTKNTILLVIIGIFLVVASVLATYTVMNYITFKNKFEEENKNMVDVGNEIEKNKKPLSNAEMEEFKKLFNSSSTSKFLSSVIFTKQEELNIVNSNLIKYVYTKFDGVLKVGDNEYTIDKDKFIEGFYNLTGRRITETEITKSSFWNEDEEKIKFITEEKEMNAVVKIDSSYKVGSKYYFDLRIDNSVYGSMSRSVVVEKTNDQKYSFVSIRATK